MHLWSIRKTEDRNYDISIRDTHKETEQMPTNTIINKDTIANFSKKSDDLFLYLLNSSTGLPWLKANISEYVFISADFFNDSTLLPK